MSSWYVAKTGNDSNDGSSEAEAKLTISAMVTASSDGDAIYIGAGDYDETVDLDTANKSITLDGVDKTACIVRTGSGEKGIVIEDNTIIKNLTVSTTSKTTGSMGVYGDTKTNLVIADCDIFGAYDGVRLDDCSEIRIRNCDISSNWDGLNLTRSTLANINNCQFSTDGAYSVPQYGSGVVIAGGSGNTVNVIFANCSSETSKSGTWAYYISGFYVQGNALLFLNNCSSEGTLNSTIGTTVSGVKTNGANSVAAVNNCIINTSVVDAGAAYDLNNTAGTIYVVDSSYDRNSTSGEILEGLRGRCRNDFLGSFVRR